MFLLFISIFGRDIAHYLWYYVFTPGNMLVAALALFTPYLVRFQLLSYIYHPYRYGGIPFVPPSFLEFQGMYYLFIILIISGMYLVSGYMATLKICNKSDYKTVLFNFRKLLFVLLMCVFVLVFLPVLKVPFLSHLIVLPYANEVVNGIFWSIFSFLGVCWANRDTVYLVCGK
jgi:uncharacterized protein YacL